MPADHDSVIASPGADPPAPVPAWKARHFPWAVLALGLALAACRGKAGVSEVCFPGGPTLTYTLPPTPSVLEVEPRKMTDALHPQPLRPDRRFLFAVADIERLLTGADPGEVRTEFGDGGWEVAYRGKVAGNLPAVPDFDEALEFLETWVLELARQERLQLPRSIDPVELVPIETDIAQFRSKKTASGLSRLDELWRESGGDARLLAPAARGLTYLTLQSVNRLENGDPLAARALAALALARALESEDLSREEALLAHYMGYAAHALRVAESLPADDPVRAFVASRDEALRRLADGPDADPLTRFLYANRLAQKRDLNQWRYWVAESAQPPEVSLSVLQTGFLVRRFELTRVLGEAYPYLALQELREATGERPPDERVTFDDRSGRSLAEAIEALRTEAGGRPAALVRHFEHDLARLPDHYQGPFLDSSAYGAFFASNFYSGLHVAATFRIASLGSAPAARQFARALKGSPGPVGDQLQRWLADLAASEGGRIDTTRMMADLHELPCLGERALKRTFDHLDERLGYGDVRRAEAVRRTARHLDTRPDHQNSYASMARDGLDLETGETHFRNVVRLAAPDYRVTEAWMARFDGDTARLRAMIEDEDLPIEDREDALENLIGGEFGDDGYVRRSAERLIADDPDRWSLRGTYIDYLVDIGTPEDGVPVVQEWLWDHSDADGFPYIFARTALAGLNYRAGRYEEALLTISPVVPSWQAGALGRAGHILEKLGRHEEARAIVADAVERYPNLDWLRAAAAEILWAQGRYDDAAGVLNDEHHPVDNWAWRHDVTEAFLTVFGKRPLEDGAEAFAALIRGGVPSWKSEGLPVGLMRAGRPGLAFTLQSQLNATETVGSLRHPINAYQYLKAWKGEDAALEWIRPRIPSRLLGDASQVMVQEGAGDLTWDLVPEPDKTRYPPGLWLMRAAAFLRERDADPARRKALMDHYRSPSDDDYVAMGRFLMGLESRDGLLARARTPDRRCEIAYYIGLKAESEGRYHDAAAWYRLALEAGQEKEYEYGFALDALSAWRNAGRSLDRLAADDVPGGP